MIIKNNLLEKIIIIVVAGLMMAGLALAETSPTITEKSETGSINIEKSFDTKQHGYFSDYQPKKSTDVVLNYRPSLKAQFDKLPSIDHTTFRQAVSTLVLQQLNSKENPGKWGDGKVAFGAYPREYFPSNDELLEAELGDRLMNYVRSNNVLSLIEAWNGETLLPFPIQYDRFEFHHADVMGSGRYYYASEPIKTIIDTKLAKPEKIE